MEESIIGMLNVWFIRHLNYFRYAAAWYDAWYELMFTDYCIENEIVCYHWLS